MPKDSDNELWSEVLRAVSEEPVTRIVLTLTSGDRFEIKDLPNFAVGRHVFTLYVDDGSVLMFQVGNIVCADIFLED